MMPSPWSSEGSITDSEALAANLGMETFTVPILPMMEAFEKRLPPPLPEGNGMSLKRTSSPASAAW